MSGVSGVAGEEMRWVSQMVSPETSPEIIRRLWSDRSLRCWKSGVSGVAGEEMGWVSQMASPETGPEIGRSLRCRPESPVSIPESPV